MNGHLDLGAALRLARAADPVAVLDVVVVAAQDLGATDIVAYMVDFEQSVLEPLPDRSAHAEVSHAEEVATTMAGRAFVELRAVTASRPDGTRVWVPILEGSDRTGVLAMTLAEVDDSRLAECADLGVLAGYLIATQSRCTDLYDLYRRRKSMTLAASMQWDLLPPLILKAANFGVAGRLEPAYEVGGDCFDYAVNGPILDVALLDAMGHGVSSALIAALALGCYRHGRREGRSLEHIHRAVDEALEAQFGGDSFVTGQLARLEVDTGHVTWTNAGHPPPLLVRGGHVIGELSCPPTVPWGLGAGEAELATEVLQPGDRVLFYTDGVIEARTARGEGFGIERLADITGRCASDQLSPEEIVRHLVRAVLKHHDDALDDDATVLLVEWSGPPGGQRRS